MLKKTNRINERYLRIDSCIEATQSIIHQYIWPYKTSHKSGAMDQNSLSGLTQEMNKDALAEYGEKQIKEIACDLLN
ncbi:hypothetical protein BgiBS90_035205, partial [Biomphalaria glabrata]